MAGIPTLKNVWQPTVSSIDPDTEVEALTLASYLLCFMDRYNNGVTTNVIKLDFADYAGLEAEWLAGTATTVLDAAVAAAVLANTSWLPETLTSAQRAVINNEYAES